MVMSMFVAAVLLFVLLFTFDISFNLRRLLKNMDRIWRKMEEMNTALQNK